MTVGKKNSDQLNAITSLRFFAALHVVLYHLYSNQYFDFYTKRINFGTSILDKIILSILQTGFVSVSLFFVLSGFILVHANKNRSLNTKDEIIKFYIARFSRIYPVYILGILAVAPIMINLLLSGQRSFANQTIGLILNVTLLQSWIAPAALSWNAPGWSLSVECLFYAAFPWLYKKLSSLQPKNLIVTTLAALFLGLVLPLIYSIASPDHLDPSLWSHAYFGDAPLLIALKFFPLARIHEFILGIAIGIAYSKRERILPNWVWNTIPIFATSILIAILYFRSERLYPLLHNGLASPLFAIIIYSLANSKLNESIKQNSLFEVLGKSSFSLYLIHGPILLSWILLTKDKYNIEYGLTNLICTVLFMNGISILIYFKIEEPMRLLIQTHIGGFLKKNKTSTATFVESKIV